MPIAIGMLLTLLGGSVMMIIALSDPGAFGPGSENSFDFPGMLPAIYAASLVVTALSAYVGTLIVRELFVFADAARARLTATLCFVGLSVLSLALTALLAVVGSTGGDKEAIGHLPWDLLSHIVDAAAFSLVTYRFLRPNAISGGQGGIGTQTHQQP